MWNDSTLWTTSFDFGLVYSITVLIPANGGTNLTNNCIQPAALPAEEAAKYIGVKRATFDRLARGGDIIGIRLSNSPVFRVETLDRFLAESERVAVEARNK
ncbi:hypothetical protein RRSWK_06939 [Rhodopirellula sp. SWK7]|nr:hypothetical protein RRSWK_06939 [Rhodopirellula sp. SWK7]